MRFGFGHAGRSELRPHWGLAMRRATTLFLMIASGCVEDKASVAEPHPEQADCWHAPVGGDPRLFRSIRTRDADGNGPHHNGYDWLVDKGSPVYAVADGEVVFDRDLPGYCSWPVDDLNTMLWIDLGEGIVVVYAHLQQDFVDVGDRVERGQKIAESGDGGCTWFEHLHFSVFDIFCPAF